MATRFNISTGVLDQAMWVKLVPIPSDVEYRNVLPDSRVYIQSPNYPNIYDPNTIKHWVLLAPEGERVVFIFKYFKTEVSDKLKIYSGEDQFNEELIGEYSDNLNRQLPPRLISTTNYVHLHFQSDNYLNAKGFSIEYSIYQSVTAVIVVLTLLLVIALTAILVYIFYYKPKKEAEMAEQTALYSKNSAYTDDLGVVIRPETSAGRLFAAEDDFLTETERPGTAAGRPGTAAGRPGTAAGRPGTAAGRPGTAAGRPGTAAGRPGTAAGRPGTAAGRPGTAAGRPGTADGRPGTADGRPDLYQPRVYQQRRRESTETNWKSHTKSSSSTWWKATTIGGGTALPPIHLNSTQVEKISQSVESSPESEEDDRYVDGW
ncbi:CDCP2 [Bugula neritina]|uniref:CDCP2 n=1 Tax=Bugula neritina TaxID=10212 RepID=A0A7J7IWR8_BUGNE|nr:CDCP2 [Bugula neritina]